MHRVVSLFILLLVTGTSTATHLRSGHISLRHQSGLTYSVTIRVFTNTTSEIRFGDGILDFGDGSKPYQTPILENTITDIPNVGVVNFSTTHTFPTPGAYVISYSEPNLDAGIINIPNSINTKFYLESGILIEPGMETSSPEFLVDQFFEQSAGYEFGFSNQAVDPADYRLAYSLVMPLPPLVLPLAFGQPNYKQPANISINQNNGLVTWDTNEPGVPEGEYLFSVRTTQYDITGRQMGYVTRSFLIRIAHSTSELAATTTVNDPNKKVFVPENGQRTIRTVWSDNSLSDEIRWSAFFDNKIASNVILSGHDSVSGSIKMSVGVITLKSASSIIRDNPYSITLRGTSSHAGILFVKDITFLFFTKDIELPVIITSTNDTTSPTIKLFPNPFSHYLYVNDQTGQSEYELVLMDLSGRVALSAKGWSNEPVDGSSLPAGMYILQIRNGQITQSQKIVKR